MSLSRRVTRAPVVEDLAMYCRRIRSVQAPTGVVVVDIRLCNLAYHTMQKATARMSRKSKSSSHELVGLFPCPFSPSQLYTTPSFIFIQTTLSSRPIGTTSPAQCTSTIGSCPIFPRASRPLEPRAVLCGRSQVSGDREAYHSASDGYPPL